MENKLNLKCNQSHNNYNKAERMDQWLVYCNGWSGQLVSHEN